MEHLGIDVHQKYSEICWLSEEGEVRQRRRLPTTEASLRRFFGPPRKVPPEYCPQEGATEYRASSIRRACPTSGPVR